MADPAGVEWVAGAVRENECLAGRLREAEPGPLDGLALPMLGKDGRERPGHGHDSPRVSALRGAEGGHPIQAREGLPDSQGPGREVDVVPREAEDLAEAKTRLETDGHRCPKIGRASGR